MSKSFHFICDKCEQTCVAQDFGDEFLPQNDWVTLVENKFYVEVDMHLCPKCNPERDDVFKKKKPSPQDSGDAGRGGGES